MNRRHLMACALGLAAGSTLSRPATSQPLADLTVTAAIRGSINASEFGVWPDALDDQSRAFRRMLEEASARQAPVFLPPGDYAVSNIRLPRSVRLAGIPGATRIVYGGDGYLLAAEDAAVVELSGLTFDGANRPLGQEAQALVEMRRVAGFAMDRCEIVGNTVRDCGEGGILVHRWRQAADGALVSDNRIERIGARSGGTGQYGNGINLFRAGNVIVVNNHVADCAFSAIRANSADNVQILGNQCLRSGETAIYSEFSFEGAVISSNLVDGAANGISVANLDQGGRLAVVGGNVVRNLVDRPPYEPYAPDVAAAFGTGIAVEADAAVTGNVVEAAPRHGFMLGWGPFLRNVAATGNVVRAAREGFAVSVVEGAGSVVIADNIVDGAERAVVGYRWAERTTGDLAAGGAAGFRHLRIERNLVS